MLASVDKLILLAFPLLLYSPTMLFTIYNDCAKLN